MNDPCARPGFWIANRYRVDGVLGEGGTALVLDALDTTSRKAVAIKVVRHSCTVDSAADRLRREGQMTVLVNHPNVCSVFDNGELPDGRPYLVMERLQGETLHSRIGKTGWLAPADAVSIMRDVACALAAAHQREILHRDIKPENIFLVARSGCAPFVKLLDFGMGHVCPRARGGKNHSLTAVGTVVGTPSYLSPEQVAGERNLDGRVDVYACGVTMFEALTGQRPFVAPTYGDLVKVIMAGAPSPIDRLRPDLPEPLVRIVKKAMAPTRGQRFSSVLELLDALALAARTMGPAARTDDDDEVTVTRVVKGFDITTAVQKTLFTSASAVTRLSPVG